MHEITLERLAPSCAFSEPLPRLTDVLHGRTLVSYKADFARSVFERELLRHHGDPATAGQWPARVRREGEMVPYTVWRGLWSVEHRTYRNQPLGGPHDAVADARLLIAKL